MTERNWLRRIPPSLAVAVLAVGLAQVRAESASPIERIWIFLAAVSAAVAIWGLSEARRTKGWVGDEAHRNPRFDYSSALIVAQTHLVTHGVLATVQLAFLLFGGFAALTLPVVRTAPPQAASPVGLALTVTLIVVELALTGLNIWLVWRREILLQKVAEIGGD